MIEILHFNDVYEIEESHSRTPEVDNTIGGAPRFVTVINSFFNNADSKPLVFFSGDAFSPSKLSTKTSGEHMVPVLNRMRITASCYGNHDFDFGIDQLIELKDKTNFPWLLSNAIDRHTGHGLGNGLRKLIIQHGDYNIGIIGLIEKDWLLTLASIEVDEVIYLDFVEEGQKLAQELKEVDGVDFVFALTHMRLPNDELLAAKVPEIDLILGGHDHTYGVKKVNDILVVKSGTDFRELTYLKLKIDKTKPKKTWSLEWKRIEVNSTVPEDQETKEVVAEFMKNLDKEVEKVIARIGVPLDGRFHEVRTQETNLSNWISDLIRAAMKTEVVIINAGTLHIQNIIEPGPFRLKDLVTLLPFPDAIVVVGLTGIQLLECLENGVSQYPKEEGRFPCVSGIRFTFNSSKPSGERVLKNSVFINGEPLDANREYSCAATYFLAKGRDGYSGFLRGRTILGTTEASVLPGIVQRALLKNTKMAKTSFEVNGAGPKTKRQKTDGEPSDWIPIQAEIDGRITRIEGV